MLLWELNWITIFGQISFGHVFLTFFVALCFCHSLTFWPRNLALFVHFLATFCRFGLVIWPYSCIFGSSFLLTAFFHFGHVIRPRSYILAMLVLATFFHFGYVIWPRLCIFGHVTFGHSLFEFPRLVAVLVFPGRALLALPSILFLARCPFSVFLSFALLSAFPLIRLAP